MNPATLYDHLSHARLDLLATLRATPDDVLRASLLRGERFHSILDLLVHTAEVEDGWIHGDFQGLPMVQDRFPDIGAGAAGPGTTLGLDAIAAYWQAVEADTRTYLHALTDADLERTVTLDDWPEGHRQFTLSGLIWHVLLHEVRHTAQIAALLRTQGIRPPQLDLLFSLPALDARPAAAPFVNPPPEDA
ncbi:DinB family protein [Deinococcus knuensis]|uniref:Damage-inducible protein DinB n=1 Tax=Deinococcus knuensis TaxID=1837380 RepID=A0ABQ2SXA3_9DEIO|nr:DinB family protein [Deinococcus knuensis]GGS42985.1 damage-inducible protein DinB [Deinococcus knuensis]